MINVDSAKLEDTLKFLDEEMASLSKKLQEMMRDRNAISGYKFAQEALEKWAK